MNLRLYNINLPLAIIMALLVAGLSGCGKKEAEEPPAVQQAAANTGEKPLPAATGTPAPGYKDPGTANTPSPAASAETVPQYLPVVGSLHARQTTRLGPQVSGRVLAMLADIGDNVKKGQELVRLDPAFFEIEIAQAKAELENARAAHADAELNYIRLKTLWEKPQGQEPSVPQKLYDDAKLKYETASAGLQQAKQALRYAEERLSETIIRAPYDAVVSARLVDTGESVTSTPVTYLLEIQETSTLELIFSLPQEYLARIKPGSQIEYEVPGINNSTRKTNISRIYPVIDETTRSFKCVALIKNHNLKPGLLVNVKIPGIGIR